MRVRRIHKYPYVLLGKSEDTVILTLVNFLAYFILTGDITIIFIKLDGLLSTMMNLDSIILIDVVLISLGSKYLGNVNELFGILVEAPCPLQLKSFEDLIINHV